MAGLGRRKAYLWFTGSRTGRLTPIASRVRRAARNRRRRTPSSGTETFFADLAQLLPTRRPANVAVLASPNYVDLGQVLDALAGARIRVFSLRSRPEWQLRRRGIRHVPVKHVGKAAWHFTRFGPFDAVINCAPPGKHGPFQTFRRLFFHLRANGVYVLDRSTLTDEQWSDMMTGLGSLPPISTADPPRNTPKDELAQAVRGIVLDRKALAITKRNDHWVKLRSGETDRFLRTRDVDATSRIITTIPEQTFRSRAELDLHISTREPVDFLPEFRCPQLYLHVYSGDITLASHSLLYCDATVLPESFRYPTDRVLGNTQLIDPSYGGRPGMAPTWSAAFARVPDRLQPERTLAGDYFHLDCPYPGHFGHMMTEVVSRLWGWDRAKQENPDLKAILRVYRDDKVPRLERDLFRAYGIAEEDIVWVGEPVRLRSVAGATPMWQNKAPQYVHPDIIGTWQRLRDGLVKDTADVPDGSATAERIFVSRPATARRACRNAAEVERYFADRGYRIVYPETMSLAEQAAIFAGARVVAGFGGSAMFNILFTRKLEKLIVLAHDSYMARNEYMFASVLGSQTHYLWSDPDLWQPTEKRSAEAFQSDWEFDFARNRDILDRIT